MDIQLRPPNDTGRKAAIPFNQRISCTVAEALSATGLGCTKLYELMNDERIKSTKVDGRRLILVNSLRQFIEGNKQPHAA
jgi:hypothetical protein